MTQQSKQDAEAHKLAQRMCRELFLTQQKVIEQHIAAHGCDEAALQTACVGAAVTFLTTVLVTCNVADPEQVMRRAVEAPMLARQMREAFRAKTEPS